MGAEVGTKVGSAVDVDGVGANEVEASCHDRKKLNQHLLSIIRVEKNMPSLDKKYLLWVVMMGCWSK